jgi:hypothetical protein
MKIVKKIIITPLILSFLFGINSSKPQAQQKHIQPEAVIPAGVLPANLTTQRTVRKLTLNFNPTAETLQQKNQEMLSLKKQLASNIEKNVELQKLLKEKKDIKKNINLANKKIQMLQNSYKIDIDEYQKAKNAGKEIPQGLQEKIQKGLSAISVIQKTELARYYKDLIDKKAAIAKTDSKRKDLIKKLHTTKQELRHMKLASEKAKK